MTAADGQIALPDSNPNMFKIFLKMSRAAPTAARLCAGDRGTALVLSPRGEQLAVALGRVCEGGRRRWRWRRFIHEVITRHGQTKRHGRSNKRHTATQELPGGAAAGRGATLQLLPPGAGALQHVAPMGVT